MTVDHASKSKVIEGLGLSTNKIIPLFCVILFFSVMNSTVFMVAVPNIATYYSLSAVHVSWVVTGFTIVYAISTLLNGKMADIYSLKLLLIVGLCVFTIGSLLGFFAPNFFFVIVARMIQAVGAGVIPALVLIVPSRYFPEKKGAILGIFTAVMGFSSGIGPVVGGFIIGFLGWKYLFLISSLIGLSIPFFWRWLPNESSGKEKIDILGGLLMTSAVGTFLAFITTSFWWLLPLSFLLFFLFLWRILKYDYPFIPTELFKNPKYSIALLVGFLGLFTFYSNMFTLPLLLNEVHGLSALSIGFVLLPGALCAALIGRFAGRLIDSHGTMIPAFLAFFLLGIGCILVSITVTLTPWITSLAVILIMVSFPFFQTSTVNLISTILPNKKIGIGLGLYNLCSFMSGAIGGAIIGKILDYSTNPLSLNPLAQTKGASVIYSNIFIGLFFLTLLNGIIFYFSYRKKT